MILEAAGSSTAEPLISLLLAGVLLVMHRWAVHFYAKRRRAGGMFRSGNDSVRKALFRRWSGVVLLGLIPISVSLLGFSRRFSEQGIVPVPGAGTWIWMGASLLIITPIIYLFARSERILEHYPEIRKCNWDRKLLAISALSWLVYLFAFEYLLRGFVLFACLRSWGTWPAVLINVALYAPTHIGQGKTEVLGAVPLGFLFCAMTLSTGAVWAAFFGHVILALSNEWITLARNPGMKVG